MYTPSILGTPMRTTGPIDPTRPGSAVTGDWSLLDGELQIGVWECSAGLFSGVTGDENEAMLMVAGRATVTHDGGEYDLAPGTLWTTPRGWSNAWTVHQTVRKLYVIDHRAGTPGGAAHLANAFNAELGAGRLRAHATAGSPHESSVTVWQHDRVEVGVWECTPGEFPLRRDGYQEVFCVLSGHATLHIDGANGAATSFELVPGAVLLTPSGTTGRWVVHETIRKAYVIVSD